MCVVGGVPKIVNIVELFLPFVFFLISFFKVGKL